MKILYNKKMLKGVSVIAFDIDGTLYPSLNFYLRLIPYFLKHFSFFLKFNKARKVLHKTAPLSDFYEYQARLLAEIENIPSEKAKSQIQQIVYDGMKPYFDKTSSFKGVKDCFEKLKKAGFRLALLSDFPPSQKGEVWGVLPYCDVVLGSEECGALKPSKYPFGILCHKLNCKSDEVLYVGNSKKYDVNGAKNAGMKTAYVLPWWRKILHLPLKSADINFSNYRQFTEIVLKSTK